MTNHAFPTHTPSHLEFHDFVVGHSPQQANARTTPSNTANTCDKTQHTAEHSDCPLPSPPNHCSTDFDERKQNEKR
jgi:hypothetical protein